MVIGGVRVSDGRDDLVFSAAAAFPKSSELLYVFGGRSSPFHPSSLLRVAHLTNGGWRNIQSTGRGIYSGQMGLVDLDFCHSTLSLLLLGWADGKLAELAEQLKIAGGSNIIVDQSQPNPI